jgi:2-polyprenyl-3-methyl-5-hydroxy-6-metoxy-1,4-benzoquinol methylase
MKTFDDGIVTMQQWEESLQSPLYADMEQYSNDFLQRNADVVEEYGKKWVRDPLHTWSRIWEYPYVATQIEKYLEKGDAEARILDGGSGVTFFPYFLCQRYSIKSLSCIDKDNSFLPMHSRLAEHTQTPVSFMLSDLASMDLPNDSVDIVYCISVLEHLPHWKQVIEEFFRVLKPGGILILTIDVSLDKRHAIPAKEAEKLVAFAAQRFAVADIHRSEEIRGISKRRDLLTMRSFWPERDDLIPAGMLRPGMKAVIESLRHLRLPRNPIPNLAIYGGVFLK